MPKSAKTITTRANLKYQGHSITARHAGNQVTRNTDGTGFDDHRLVAEIMAISKRLRITGSFTQLANGYSFAVEAAR